MALIISDSSTCSICGEILKSSDDVISWQAFLKPEHKFWKYSDSGMHRYCFEKWEHKDEFDELYKSCLDFDALEIKAQIEQYGMPDWLQEIKDYRKINTSHNKG